MIVRGTFKGREGKVLSVFRRKFVLHIEHIVKDKANGQQVPVGIDASKVVITKLKMDKDRKALLERKKSASAEKSKGKVNQVMAEVD